MLEMDARRLFIYVVARDFGFAPNPFHGYCTLATCKAGIRKSAQVGDWVMGVGGTRLKATGRCIYLMMVTEKTTFDEYWNDGRFGVKKPLRNGSSVMMVGDNIYHRKHATGEWTQADSHHSNPDGSTNMDNLAIDTRSESVLISTHYYYFGSNAPEIDLAPLGNTNVRSYRNLSLGDGLVRTLIESTEEVHQEDLNQVAADPFDFARASERVDQSTGKLA